MNQEINSKRELSPAEIERTIEKLIRPIDSSGTGVHAINGMTQPDREWPELIQSIEQVLIHGLLSKCDYSEWRELQDQIRSNRGLLKAKPSICTNIQWIRELPEQEREFEILKHRLTNENYVFFNLVGYDIASVQRSYFNSSRFENGNVSVILNFDDLLNSIEPRDKHIWDKIHDRYTSKAINSNGGVLKSFRNEENTITPRKMPIPFADDGYRIHSRISLNRVIGLALTDNLITEENIQNLKTLSLKTGKHIPIYSAQGDLIYPFVMPLEEIKSTYPERYREYPRYKEVLER